ncbi:MAG: rhodanese-like domain-containing protein [Proteobacteria bacterium]|nr:rhodanese-like domain-containing protein [Pseudomonadota bacterium]
MQQISAVELNERLHADEPPPLLLDVREPHEFGRCRIEGSVNMPMSQVFAGSAKLDPQQETVVICHHGMRSAQIANFLLSRGFSKIINLTGGVAAWASQVDPSMPTY